MASSSRKNSTGGLAGTGSGGTSAATGAFVAPSRTKSEQIRQPPATSNTTIERILSPPPASPAPLLAKAKRLIAGAKGVVRPLPAAASNVEWHRNPPEWLGWEERRLWKPLRRSVRASHAGPP